MGNDSLYPPNKLKKAAGWPRLGSSFFLLQILTTGAKPIPEPGELGFENEVQDI